MRKRLGNTQPQGPPARMTASVMPATARQRPPGVMVPALRHGELIGVRRRFSAIMHGVDDGCAQEACIFTPSPGTKSIGSKSTGSKNAGSKNTCADDRAEGRAKTLVAARHGRERRARSASRRVQADQREEDRGLAEAFGGTQRAPQIRRLSLGAVDADLLHQPRRQEFTEDRAQPAGAGKDGIEARVREGVGRK